METDNELHTAAGKGNLAEVQAQVGNFDINQKGRYGETALFKAADKGRTEVVDLLLTLNADVNIPSVSTQTMISVHLICIFPSHISTQHPHFYSSRHVLLSRVVDVPSSTNAT